MSEHALSERPGDPVGAWRGRTLGGYTITEHLDTGGMAEIFLAQHERPGGFRREVVLKLLQPRFCGDPRVVAMFADEARIGARLHHPAIVEVFDAGEEDGQHFIAMEYIEGRTLTELARRGLEVSRPLPLNAAVYVCAQVAEGLAYMNLGTDRRGQRLNVVHRDISPTNIIVSDRGHTKIIDFGVATDRGDSKEETEARPGKYSYMSPEQVRGERLDGRSDVFSLGIILYELTLGRRLFRGKPQEVMKRIAEDRVRPPTFVNRGYPPALETIVLRALERRPEDRYASADELARALDDYLSAQPERVTERRLATYVADIERGDAQISDLGARRAAAFVLEDEDVSESEEEELDLDRARPGWGVSGPTPDDLDGAAPVAEVAAPVASRADAAPPPDPRTPVGAVVPIVCALVGALAGALVMWALLR